MKELSMLPASASVRIEKGEKNGAAIYLIGASEKESLLYARGLMQMCGPVKTPRYLLCQKKLFGRGRAYAVPDFLGGKKETAAVLFFHVRRRFMHLVYIQSEEGKRQLLKARLSELRIKRDAVRIVKSVCGI